MSGSWFLVLVQNYAADDMGNRNRNLPATATMVEVPGTKQPEGWRPDSVVRTEQSIIILHDRVFTPARSTARFLGNPVTHPTESL